MNIGDIQKKQKPAPRFGEEVPPSPADLNMMANPFNLQLMMASFMQMASMGGFGAPNASLPFAGGLPPWMAMPNAFPQPKPSAGLSSKKVVNIPMVSLDNYEDLHAVRDKFECLRDVNDGKFRTDAVKDAEFYIIRSSNDDDIHKVV